MSVGKSNRLSFFIALTAACVLLPFATQARQQTSPSQQAFSVADAARRARQQKKNSAKASKVIDDDNLSSNIKPGPDVINVGAPASELSNPGEVGNTANADQAAHKQADPSAAGEDAEIARLKEQVAQSEKELDLLKREFALDSEAYYSKTDFSSDKAGKAKLDGEQQQISDKQQELERLKTRLAALLELQTRRKPKSAQAPSGQSEKPANPQP
jgi:DNA repair exonuclease SbcCD ATPase subunit